MGSVFISYRSTDRDFVLRLAEDLVKEKFDVWLDQWQISGRLPYWEEIQAAVEQCTHFVFVISPESIQRDSGAMTELLHAIQFRPTKVIVPIIYKPTPFSSIPMVIGPGKLQIHDFTTLPYEEGLLKVIRALRSELPTPASDTQKQMSPVPPPERTEVGGVKSSQVGRSGRLPRWASAVAIIAIAGILIVGGVVAVNNFRLNLLTMTPPTLTPTNDPRVATVLSEEAQTRIAQSPSETVAATPTPTVTLTETPIDPNDFVAQTFSARTDQAATTIEAYTKTPTPTSTLTPNYQQTAEFIVGATDVQATANVMASYTKILPPPRTFTNTPTYTFTPTTTYTSTATLTFTLTPSITLTPTLAPYPTLDETQTPTTWKPIVRTFDYNGYSVEMVLVPAGRFMMGDSGNNPQRIEQPFWIDRYEVTNEQFDTLRGAAVTKSNWADPQRPREQITWEEVKVFCEQKRGGFLPTESQWEWAARGPQNLQYPWGNNWDPAKVVWNRNSSDGTANVSSKPEGKSWVGALDMSGNVWEWTSSIYKSYPYLGIDGRENPFDHHENRVLRGGSWFVTSATQLRSSYRNYFIPTYFNVYVGFRCIRYF